MKLDHLIRTLKTCVDFHTRRGNETKVSQLRAKLMIAESKALETKIEYIYVD